MKEELQRHSASCAAETGYDPDGIADIGEYELGPDERAFLSCAYARIKEFVVPNAAIPEAYTSFIDEYERMTDAVENGDMKRSERQARAQALLEEIRLKEEAKDNAGGQEFGKQTSQALERLEQEIARRELSAFTNEMVRETLKLPPPTFR